MEKTLRDILLESAENLLLSSLPNQLGILFIEENILKIKTNDCEIISIVSLNNDKKDLIDNLIAVAAKIILKENNNV